MIYFFISGLFMFYFDKLKNKLTIYIFNGTLKRIKWYADFHKQKYISRLLDFIYIDNYQSLKIDIQIAKYCIVIL